MALETSWAKLSEGEVMEVREVMEEVMEEDLAILWDKLRVLWD